MNDFTEYLSSLDASGNPPDRAAFDAVWRAFVRALRSEIRKRGLWDRSPRFLGVEGVTDWWSDDGQGLEELASDCYVYVFVTRLQSLRAQLERKQNIEGLVFRSIRNFLHEVQRKHDPLGFRVFESLRMAIHLAMDNDRLFVVQGDERIRNDTVLAFSEALQPPIEGDELAVEVRSWAPHLLPDLVLARAEQRKLLIDDLSGRLLQLEQFGGAFVFLSVIEPLKHALRSEWAARFEETLGDEAAEYDEDGVRQLVRVVAASRAVEEADSLQSLELQVGDRLAAVGDDRTRRYLQVLWRFLGAFATGEHDLSDDKLPSARALARQIGIPRERLPVLFEQLREIVLEVQSANPMKSEVSGQGGRS